MILGETHYPGWKLTIDGEPANILRANRVMRGALVKGSPKIQKLIYTYEPSSFRWGLHMSLMGVVGFLTTLFWAFRSPRRPGPEVE